MLDVKGRVGDEQEGAVLRHGGTMIHLHVRREPDELALAHDTQIRLHGPVDDVHPMGAAVLVPAHGVPLRIVRHIDDHAGFRLRDHGLVQMAAAKIHPIHVLDVKDLWGSSHNEAPLE